MMKGASSSKGYSPTHLKLMFTNPKQQSKWYPLAGTFLLGIVCGLFISWQKAPAPLSSIAQTALGSSVESSVRVLDDELFLGPQQGDHRPARLAKYELTIPDYQHVYDKSWLEGGYPKQSCWGCRFAADVIARTPAHTILDAGAGNGVLLRQLRAHGKSAWGIELSRAVLESECPDLLESGIVEQGSLTNLPYADNQFDLVFSADVLEHIRPSEVDTVVRELVRVSRRHLFLSISLKGHTKVRAGSNEEANRHTMLRPRHWWEAKFLEHGAVLNRELVWALQERDGHFTDKEMRQCRTEGVAGDGGTYQVCVVDSPWLVGSRDQENLRKDRCITPENGELEPWFFAFRKLR